MTSTHQIALPERFRLEEINMPVELASALAGRTVDVEVLPEVWLHRCGMPLRCAPLLDSLG
jgi:hypothetical protein